MYPSTACFIQKRADVINMFVGISKVTAVKTLFPFIVLFIYNLTVCEIYDGKMKD